jgi:transcriptional regulator with XRE-family HTH domain
MLKAPAPENPTSLSDMSEALGKALATGTEAVINVMEQAFEANPALAMNEEVKLGFLIGAELGRHSGISSRAAHMLNKLATSPTIPDAVRKTREALQLSQAQLGAKLGVTQASISEWETGRHPITARALGTLIRLAKSKGIDVSDPQKPAPRISGNALRRLRLSMGKTRSEMGEMLGLSETSIRLYEGRSKPPGAILAKIEAFKAGDTATAARPFRHAAAA